MLFPVVFTAIYQNKSKQKTLYIDIYIILPGLSFNVLRKKIISEKQIILKVFLCYATI